MEYFHVELDPILVSVAIVVMLIFFALLIFVYIPRIEDLSRLEKQNQKLRYQVAKLSEELSIELKDKMDLYNAYIDELTKKDGRIKQAEDKAKTFCEYADSLKNKEG